MPESDVWLAHRRESRALGGRPSQIRVVAQLVGPALRKTTALAFMLTGFNMAAYWFKTIWLPTYFHEIRGLSLGDSAWLFFMDQLGSLTGYVCFGFASDRFGRRPSFALFAVMKAFGLIVITLGWDTVAGHRAALLVVMFAVGFGEGNWGCIGPLLNKLFPTAVRGAALGIIYNVSRGVQFLAPVVIALVAARFTFGAGVALAAPFALLAGASVWALPETKGKQLPDAFPPRLPASGEGIFSGRKASSSKPHQESRQ